MRLFSCFSGIEAATVALGPLGFETVGLSEVDAFPNAVLEHHYPTVKNYGDITKHREWDLPGSGGICVGGPPCQSFSLGGLRKGLDDPRGNLSLTYLAFIDRVCPRWIIMENVPGLLSSNKGRDFGSILGALAKLGYGFAYCVLDAQNFGVPQRRRRVFLVGHSGGCWQRPAAVLFNPKSLFWDNQESGQKRQDNPKGIAGGVYGDNQWPGKISSTIPASFGEKRGLDTQHMSEGGGLYVPDQSHCVTSKWAKGSGGHSGAEHHNLVQQDLANCLTARTEKGINTTLDEGQTPVRDLPRNKTGVLSHIRRLTPRECERLQGFPDDYTRIPYRGKPADKCPDGPRYKALGNSWAVPVVQWIGQRILEVDALKEVVVNLPAK